MLINETRLIYKVISGSRAYGTANESSDLDIRGVFIGTFEQLILPNQKIESVTNQFGEDILYYELGKFMQLVLKQNPTVLELLWLKDEFILNISEHFIKIKENKKAFLSKELIAPFLGYAIQEKRQMATLENSKKKSKCCHHLFRLLYSAKAVLLTHELPTQLKEKEEILLIKNTIDNDYQELMFKCDILIQEIKELEHTSKLRDKCDYALAYGFITDIYKTYFYETQNT